MGDFRITVDAVGGHGCMRELGNDEVVIGCDRPGCPDCMAREFVRRLKRSGATVNRAQIEHWPEDQYDLATQTERPGARSHPGPVDDLLTGRRRGSW